MRSNDVWKVALMAALLTAGCKSGAPSGTSTPDGSMGMAGTSGTVASTVATVTKVSVCEKCEDRALEDRALDLKKVNVPNSFQNAALQPSEFQSLTNALPAAVSAGAATVPHVHAEAVNGELVFHADDNAPDVAKAQMGMVVERKGGAPQAVRVVATPEAARLLHQRAN